VTRLGRCGNALRVRAGVDDEAFHQRYRQGRWFRREVGAEVEIAAPVGRVWDALVDLAAYPTWNPFTVAVRGGLRVGSPVDLFVSFDGRRPFRQREWVNRVEAGRVLCWGTRMGPAWVLTANRWQWVEPLGADRCRYRTTDRFSGWLVPLVFASYGPAMERAFTAMARALAREVERRG